MSLLIAGVAVTLALVRPASSSSAPQGRVQQGLASYYGPGFHGKRTASGETFNQNRMTAAHRTLPLGSVVRVTNLDNGNQVVLRVTDRGPYGRNYRKGTILDVSKGAAQRLDFIEEGLVRVKVEVVELPEAKDGRRGSGE